MSQSVKLSNGNYIDAEGVWDATQGKSQRSVNAHIRNAYMYSYFNFTANTVTYTLTFSTHTPCLLIIDQNGETDMYVLNTLTEAHQFLKESNVASPTKVSDGVYSIPVRQWGMFTILAGREPSVKTNS